MLSTERLYDQRLRELNQEINQIQLVRQAQAGMPARHTGPRRLLYNIGNLLSTWGAHLQKNFAARATIPPAQSLVMKKAA